jgi:hypothetical protein
MMSDFNRRLGTNSMSPITLDEYEKLPSEEKEHFAECLACGEIFDRRSLDKVLFHHTDHKDRPDIQYSGWEKLDWAHSGRASKAICLRY